MKRKDLLIAFFLVCAIISFMVLNFEKSYSYGFYMTISGTKAGSRTLKYYDENDNEISLETAVKYYGATRYQEMPSSSGTVYFYNGKETTEAKYKTGFASEQADLRAAQYGNAGIRVSSTANFKAAWDDMFLNYRSGMVVFTWSQYDNIDFDAVEKYVMSKYGVETPYQNYYPYSLKGPQEPIRFSLDLADFKSQGEYTYNNYWTRHTGAEKQKVDNYLDNLFKNNILPAKSASDYQKISAVFDFIYAYAPYYVDQGFENDYISGFTSMYDVLLTGKANCIGYSNTFSYIMERYGIESYVIDGAITVDVANQFFDSQHTYNIVKLDGKFYRIDLTGKSVFLGPLTLKLVPDKGLPIATSSYTPTGTDKNYKFSWDKTKVENFQKQALNLSVTTTTKRALTTTKTVTTKMGAAKTTTTKKGGSGGGATTTTTEYTGVTGTGVVINTDYITTTTTSEYITTTTTSEEASAVVPTTTKPSDDNPEEDDKLKFNIIMIGLAVVIIIGYIIYKVVITKKSKSVANPDAQAILNKGIVNSDNNSNNNMNYSQTPMNNNLNNNMMNGTMNNAYYNNNMVNSNMNNNTLNNNFNNDPLNNNLNNTNLNNNMMYNTNNMNNMNNNVMQPINNTNMNNMNYTDNMNNLNPMNNMDTNINNQTPMNNNINNQGGNNFN